MALPKISFKQAYWLLAGLGGLYIILLMLLTNPYIQRQALYAHRISTAGWWHDLSEPEQFGFLNNQIQPALIPTPDGETLHGWHVVPVGAYARHEAELSGAASPASLYPESGAFGILSSDPQAKLIINFHGNAGHVAQGWRTDTYFALTAADNEHAHVFSFDYRGYGHSTGVPSEEGLIEDGVAVVEWFLAHGVSPDRIVMVGNSLGVAVAIATARRMLLERPQGGVEFAGLVLVAGFGDLPALLTTYTILHAIPVFGPLRGYPTIQKYFADKIVDRWDNVGRLYEYVRAAKATDITLIHALNDYDIPWEHSNALFYAAANATSADGLTASQIHGIKEHRKLKRGGHVDTWKAAGSGGKLKKIKQIILRDGGHNRIMTFAPVTKAIVDIFRPI